MKKVPKPLLKIHAKRLEVLPVSADSGLHTSACYSHISERFCFLFRKKMMQFNPKQMDLCHATVQAARVKFTYLVFLVVTAQTGRGEWQD